MDTFTHIFQGCFAGLSESLVNPNARESTLQI